MDINVSFAAGPFCERVLPLERTLGATGGECDAESHIRCIYRKRLGLYRTAGNVCRKFAILFYLSVIGQLGVCEVCTVMFIVEVDLQ